jgi:hypothetical protein
MLLYRLQACDEDAKGRPVIDSRHLIERSNAASETSTSARKELMTCATTPKEELTYSPKRGLAKMINNKAVIL